MLRIERILFPTDFSDCAEHAFSQAAHLVQALGAEFHVLHVLERRRATADIDEAMPEQIMVHMNQHLQQARAALAVDVDFVEAQVTAASAAHGILTYAEGQRIDLIVMGTHGRRGTRRLLLGSVAEEVARAAPCPVCTIGLKTKHRGVPRLHRFLVPVDFSDVSAQALRLTGNLAARFGGRIHVLHILEETRIPGVYELEAAHVHAPEAKERARQRLVTWIEEVGVSGVPYSVHARFGYPARDIVDYAKNHHLDLIVMATHGRTGVRRMLLGSVAEKVIRTAASPVLCTRQYRTRTPTMAQQTLSSWL